jgi:hypothetical protein
MVIQRFCQEGRKSAWHRAVQSKNHHHNERENDRVRDDQTDYIAAFKLVRMGLERNANEATGHASMSHDGQ